MRALLVLAAALAGALSGAAGTLLHQRWWGLGLALVTGVAVLAWLPPGAARVLFALGWCVPVLRGALPRPAGGYLVAADAAGWSLLAGSAVLLMAALATVRSRTSTAPDEVEDPGVRRPAT
ncbi:hypothetical protein [Nocardioides sp. SYSU D00065]|uniref:hypothetical protein n=1 Tax=Nocardioides sp. SYSU D00065 TaxID=2817378 RepID=UPI001B31A609|nr:hypothetical protein [Nocardioides sp. SYSU D00065]